MTVGRSCHGTTEFVRTEEPNGDVRYRCPKCCWGVRYKASPNRSRNFIDALGESKIRAHVRDTHRAVLV